MHTPNYLMADITAIVKFIFSICCLLVIPLIAEQEPVVIAHRGASAYVPEHSLIAVTMAHALGADYIEQDLVLTKDKIPVVLHDTQIDTVTNVKKVFPDRARKDGRFYALDFTLAELKQLRLHERVDHRTGKAVFPKRFPLDNELPLHIPTLEEELQLIAGLNQSTGREVGIYPELKRPKWHREQGYDISSIVIPILQKYGYNTKDDACWVQCFEWEEVKRVRKELNWKGKLLLLGNPLKGVVKSETDWKKLAEVVDGLGPSLTAIINPDGSATGFVKQAHAHGLKVHPYTVRQDALPRGMKSLDDFLHAIFVQAKIDGVFTDFPDSVANFIQTGDTGQ